MSYDDKALCYVFAITYREFKISAKPEIGDNLWVVLDDNFAHGSDDSALLSTVVF